MKFFEKFKEDLNKDLKSKGQTPATNKDIILGFAVLLVPVLFIGSCLFGGSETNQRRRRQRKQQ